MPPKAGPMGHSSRGSESRSTINGRLHGLDTLRGLLMTAGILVHASLMGRDGFFAAVQYISSLFRMEAFFTIAGLLAALSFFRRGSGWLPQRLVTLLVPFAFGTIVLNTLNQRLIAMANASPGFAHGYFPNASENWHLHLWFLATLAFLSILTFMLFRDDLDRRIETSPVGKAATAIIRQGQGATLGTVVLLSMAGYIVARAVVRSGLIPDPLAFIVQTTIYYSTFYLLGTLMARSQNVYAHMTRFSPLLFAAAATMVALNFIPAVKEALPPAAFTLLSRLIETLAGIAIVNALLAVFAHMRHVPWVLAKIADASYTIYLLHYILITAGLFVLSSLLTPRPLAYVVICLSVLSLTLAIHFGIVKRSRIASLLLNGRINGTGPIIPSATVR